MKALTAAKRKKIKAKGLAEKYGVTPQYVNAILRGDRKAESKKASAVLRDALSILSILETARK